MYIKEFTFRVTNGDLFFLRKFSLMIVEKRLCQHLLWKHQHRRFK